MKKQTIVSQPPSPFGDRSGSALGVVLIFMGILSIATASLLNLGMGEMNLNGRRMADIEAKHVAESALEIATAHLQEEMENTSSAMAEDLTISVSDEELALLYRDSRYITGVSVESEPVRTLIDTEVYVDPQDPSTLLDPHRGSYVTISEWLLTAHVDVDYRSHTRTVTATQRFQVRGSPFFTHAILYNMDLEFHPGANMVVSGPVHSNGNVWLASTTGSQLFFTDAVSATKAIRVGAMQTQTNSSKTSFQENWSGSNIGGHTARNVWFNTNGVYPPSEFDKKTKDGIVYSNLYNTPAGGNYKEAASYFDSLSQSRALGNSSILEVYTGFDTSNEFYDKRFDGNLGAGSERAPKIMPAFLPDYVAEDGTGNGMNSGYALIEPKLESTAPEYKGEFEKQKLASKAGLNLKVVYVDDGTAPADFNAVRLVKKGESRYKLKKNGEIQRDKDGNPKLNEEGLSDYWLIPNNPVSGSQVKIQDDVVDTFLQVRVYDEGNDGKPLEKGGIYDRRRLKPVDLLDLNLNAFNTEIVDSPAANRFSDGTSITYNPASDYNGVVYVEFPTATSTTTRADNIVVAEDNYRDVSVDGTSGTVKTGLGLLVTDARKVPDPSYNIDTTPGFTLATNGTAYIKGSYNADGIKGTGSSTEGDGKSGYDTVAAIAADAITFLSDAFEFEKSKGDKSDRDAVFTEVNAALLSGITPTNTPNVDFDGDGNVDDIVSGGSHNFPRFLEDWNTTFRYRGSIVSFFESEIAIEPQEQKGNSWYGAPTRDYGFFEVFGTGKQPPGTPMGRSYFKLDFRIL